MKQDHPLAEIAAGNRWYVSDQFRSQLGTRGRRRLIEYRWRVFAAMLREWRFRHGHTGVLRVLDAGCGDGINLVGLRTVAAAESVPLRLFGLDYNPLRLTRARAANPEARLQQGSLYQLPFADGAFDAVLCNHVIEHVPDLQTALSELMRVLRPGGLLIVGTPNEGCVMAKVRNRLIQPSIGRTTDHIHFFTWQTLTRALSDVGLAIAKIERETFFFPCSYVNMGFTELGIGHALMAGLRRLFPSQAGGLIVASEKPHHA